jgi:hypothetical protein
LKYLNKVAAATNKTTWENNENRDPLINIQKVPQIKQQFPMNEDYEILEKQIECKIGDISQSYPQ